MRTCHQNTGIELNKYFYIQQIRCQAGQTAGGRIVRSRVRAKWLHRKGLRFQVSGRRKNLAMKSSAWDLGP